MMIRRRTPGDATTVTLVRYGRQALLRHGIGNHGKQLVAGADGTTFSQAELVAPTDGVNDGYLANLTAEQITISVPTGQFPYAVDYFGYWLDQESAGWVVR